MAKITLGNLAPRSFPASKGKFVLRDTAQGPVVQSTPRRSPDSWSELQRHYRIRFGLAAYYAANPFWSDLATAIHMSEGTEQTPRDILTMAALGTYYIIRSRAGQQWQSSPNPVYPP